MVATSSIHTSILISFRTPEVWQEAAAVVPVFRAAIREIPGSLWLPTARRSACAHAQGKMIGNQCMTAVDQIVSSAFFINVQTRLIVGFSD